MFRPNMFYIFVPIIFYFNTIPWIAAQQVTVNPMWLDVYGTLQTADGNGAAIGTRVQAFDTDGVLCGECLVRTTGRYGFMPVYADDPFTAGVDEGAEEGDRITFRINGVAADVLGNTIPRWSASMNSLRIDLVESGYAVKASLYEYWAKPGETFIVPLVLNDLLGHDIYSADIKLSFDASVLEAKGASTSGCIAQGWGDPTFDVKPDGQIWLAMAGTSALTESGILVNVSFDVKGAEGDSCSIHFIEVTLNQGTPPASLKDGVFHVGEWPTEVRSEDVLTPNQFELQQNYPNPFNPETTIRFSLPRASHVTLKLYDLMGKEVAILVDGRLEAGGHKVVFDARTLVSGVYFYRMQAEGFADTKRLIVMK
jgi:hypothetical protein